MRSTLVFTPTGGKDFELAPAAGGAGVFLPKDDVGQMFPLPEYDEQFAESPDTEGALRTRSRPKNPVGQGQVTVSGHDQAAFSAYYREWQALVEAMRRFGGTMKYTPAGGQTITYEVISMRLTSAPYDGTRMLAYVQTYGFEFTCKPYGILPEVESELRAHDAFTYNSFANKDWTFDAGSGTLSTSEGKAVPSSTAAKRLYRAGLSLSNGTHDLGVTTGASVASGTTELTLKRVDAENELRARISFSGATTTLQVLKRDAGAESTLASSGAFTPGAKTTYYLRAKVTGNEVIVSVFTEDPRFNAAAVAVKTVSHTLAGADASKFGSGVFAAPGMRLAPQGTDYRWTDWSAGGTIVRTTQPIASFEVPDVPGDVPALGELTVTDTAAQNRRHLEVGLEAGGTSYDQTAAPPTLVDSELLETAGFSGASETASGAYGEKAIKGTIGYIYPRAICGVSGEHVGPYRVKARVKAESAPEGSTVYVRLSFRNAGSNQLTANDYVAVPANGSWCELDLGVIEINPVATGEQRWEGRVETYVSVESSPKLLVDYVEMIGASRWAKSSAGLDVSTPANLKGWDEFTYEVEGGLSATALPDGSGNWTTGGSAKGDFQKTKLGYVKREAKEDSGEERWARAPAASLPVVASSMTWQWRYPASTELPPWTGPQLQTSLQYGSFNPSMRAVYLGNPATTGESYSRLLFFGTIFPYAWKPNTWYTFTTLVVGGQFALGWITYEKELPTGPPHFISSTTSFSSAQTRFADFYTGTLTLERLYTQFQMWVPEIDASIFSGRKAKLRWADGIRQNEAGTRWGGLPNFEGARLRIPAAGQRDLSSRLAVKARRNNVDEFVDENLADQLQAELVLKPRVVLLG